MKEHHWQHAMVRDMDWILSSPPLLTPHSSNDTTPIHWVTQDECERMRAVSQQWLLDLDNNPAPLQRLLNASRDHRLGHYFETLLAFWLAWPENPLYRLIARNLPIRDGKRTVGEMDFLVQARETGEFQHWEVAVKFYLGVAAGGDYASWQGPGLKDRLDIKVDHLLQHQLKLGESRLAQKTFQTIGLPACLPQPVCFLKGRLFYPMKATVADWAPRHANPQHLTGWWLTFDDFVTRYNMTPLRWLLLPREHWLSTLESDTVLNQVPLTAEQLVQPLQNEADPRAIAVIGVAQNTDASFQEVTRGFITPPQWLYSPQDSHP